MCYLKKREFVCVKKKCPVAELTLFPEPINFFILLGTCKWTDWNTSCKPFCNKDGTTMEGVPKKKSKRLISSGNDPKEHCEGEVEKICPPKRGE